MANYLIEKRVKQTFTTLLSTNLLMDSCRTVLYLPTNHYLNNKHIITKDSCNGFYNENVDFMFITLTKLSKHTIYLN